MICIHNLGRLHFYLQRWEQSIGATIEVQYRGSMHSKDGIPWNDPSEWIIWNHKMHTKMREMITW